MATKKGTVIYVLMWLWQAPQCLLALVLFLFVKTERIRLHKGVRVVYCKNLQAAVSLGQYIFITDDLALFWMRHEYGHCIQSRWLGPLYLLLVGVPSIIWNLLVRNKPKGVYESLYWPEGHATLMGDKHY